MSELARATRDGNPLETAVTTAGNEVLPVSSGTENTLLAAIAPLVVSPSLGFPSAGAYELKFLIDPTQARDVVEWSRRHLSADPHSDPLLGDGEGGYLVNTLYLDTPELDVFHRTDRLGPQKFRLRRYGEEPIVWLELKQKREGLVRKRRVAVAETDVTPLLSGGLDAGWEGDWFRQDVDRHELRPICHVTYRRFARVAHTPGGTVRLTLDDEVRGEEAENWEVRKAPLRTPSLLEGKRILELKFRDAMPALFRGLVMDLGLTPGSFSKYRAAAADSALVSAASPFAPTAAGEVGDA